MRAAHASSRRTTTPMPPPRAIPIVRTWPITRPATRTGAPSPMPVASPKWIVTSTPPCSSRGSTITTNTTVKAATASTAAPTRRVSRSSWIARATSLLPEQLPRVVLEVVHHLADVGVHVELGEQRADRALAGAQVGDHAVGVGQERARGVGGVA